MAIKVQDGPRQGQGTERSSSPTSSAQQEPALSALSAPNLLSETRVAVDYMLGVLPERRCTENDLLRCQGTIGDVSMHVRKGAA